MTYHRAYLDESGDLGWTLNQPYRKSGSSRFFTIALLILPQEKEKHINRFLRKFHKERGGQDKEYKGASFSSRKAKSMARKILGFIEHDPDMHLGAVTINKAKVPSMLTGTENSNILYNHMVQALLCPMVKHYENISIIPDKRSVPSGSQNSCADLIKHKLWCEFDSRISISYKAEESQYNQRLQFIDWIANFVWRSYEDSHKNSSQDAYQIISPSLQEKTIYF